MRFTPCFLLALFTFWGSNLAAEEVLDACLQVWAQQEISNGGDEAKVLKKIGTAGADYPAKLQSFGGSEPTYLKKKPSQKKMFKFFQAIETAHAEKRNTLLCVGTPTRMEAYATKSERAYTFVVHEVGKSSNQWKSKPTGYTEIYTTTSPKKWRGGDTCNVARVVGAKGPTVVLAGRRAMTAIPKGKVRIEMGDDPDCNPPLLFHTSQPEKSFRLSSHRRTINHPETRVTEDEMFKQLEGAEAPYKRCAGSLESAKGAKATFDVTPAGKVTNLKVEGERPSKKATSCLKKTIAKLRFPKKNTKQNANVTIVFEPMRVMF